jgi:hypothetical protein
MLRGGDEAQREEWGWRLAAWSGDLGRAESSARAALAAMGPGATLTQQSLATWAIVQVLLEEGRAHDAGAVALDFLDRRTLLTPSVADSVGQDATPVLLAVAARAGLLSEAQRRARRDAFLEAWSTLAPGEEDRRSANIDAFVEPVESKEEALEAVARLPDLLPLGPDWYGRRAFLVGKVYLLAGRAEEAVAACFPLTHAIDSARAAAMLGRALDATGDRAGACDAYRAVLERWRGATPRSVTLEDARRAAAADGCGR